MGAQSRLVVRGVDEFARELRAVDRRLPRHITAGHRQIAREEGGRARTAAASRWGPHASQAMGIKWSASTRRASLKLDPNRHPRVLAAELGARKHVVFGRPVAATSMARRVFPAWTGNQFTPGDGPAEGVGTAVHPSVREGVQSGRIAAGYADHVMDALARAFPERA